MALRVTRTVRYAAKKIKPPSSPFDALGFDLSAEALGAESTARASIDALGPTSFTISGVRVAGSVLVLSRMSTFWNVESMADVKPEAFALLKLIRPRPETVLIGTGARIQLLDRDVKENLKELSINVETMDTKNACHTFNVLNQEGRSVAAALLPAARGTDMNKIESIRKLNATELEHNIAGTPASWHDTYRTCPFVYVGGLPLAFTEGDLLAIFEQFGTVVLVDLVRDADNGKSKGFGFLQYRDPRSAVLAVDNFGGVELGGRVVSVDHAAGYERRDGRGVDTAPREVTTTRRNAPSEVVANGRKVQDQDEKDAESRRERAVMKRLEMMRRKTDASLGESSGVEKVIGKKERRRKDEKEARKEERARIREERRRRRALRETN